MYSKLLEMDANNRIFNSTILANRALCHQKKGNHLVALQDINKSIDYNNLYLKAYYRRATIYVHLKNGEKAKQDLQKILKIDPSKFLLI